VRVCIFPSFFSFVFVESSKLRIKKNGPGRPTNALLQSRSEVKTEGRERKKSLG
jgi:hypothetical protein